MTPTAATPARFAEIRDRRSSSHLGSMLSPPDLGSTGVRSPLFLSMICSAGVEPRSVPLSRRSAIIYLCAVSSSSSRLLATTELTFLGNSSTSKASSPPAA